MVATPGTFPSYPPYQPGALSWTGQEIGLLVSDAQSTAAATYRYLLVDQVGKAPSVMSHGFPNPSDLISFYQPTTGLYFSATVSQFAIVASQGIPADGATNQVLAKSANADFAVAWTNISQIVLVDGTTLVTTGTPQLPVLQINAGGVGSTQLGVFAVQQGNIGTNVVGDQQIRQGVGLSVIGVSGSSLANVADIVAASTAGLTLQVDPTGTSLVWATPLAVAPFNTTFLSTSGILYGNGSATVGISAAGTTAWPLVGQGTTAAPVFQVLTVPGGGSGTSTIKQNALVYGNGSSVIGMLSGATSGLPFISQGTTQLPAFGALSLSSSNVTGLLTMINGGLGTTTLGIHGPLIGAGTSVMTIGTAGTNGQVFLGQGASNDPAFKSIVQDLSIASTGTATVLGIQSFAVVSTAPSTSQYLQWSGSAWTPASAVLISPTTIATVLPANVTLSLTASFFDTVSVAQGTTGIWYASGAICVYDATLSTFRAKLWDGSTIMSSVQINSQAGNESQINMCGIISNPVGNIKISVEDITTNQGVVFANLSGLGTDCSLSAIRIG